MKTFVGGFDVVDVNRKAFEVLQFALLKSSSAAGCPQYVARTNYDTEAVKGGSIRISRLAKTSNMAVR